MLGVVSSPKHPFLSLLEKKIMSGLDFNCLWLQLHQWLESLSVAQQIPRSYDCPDCCRCKCRLARYEAPFFIFSHFSCVFNLKTKDSSTVISLLGFICPWVAFLFLLVPLSLCAPAFLLFPMKCDKKISIDIFLKGKERKKLEQQRKVLLSDSTTVFFLKNWVWHRKITPLEPFFASLHLLPAIQTYTQSGL